MAEILRKIRENAGLSQTQVAERIGLSSKTKNSYISHLEKGRLKNPALGLILLYHVLVVRLGLNFLENWIELILNKDTKR